LQKKRCHKRQRFFAKLKIKESRLVGHGYDGESRRYWLDDHEHQGCQDGNAQGEVREASLFFMFIQAEQADADGRADSSEQGAQRDVLFMEMLSAIAPFFVAGLMGTVFARFTGINMSMCVLLMFLYMGAKPVECIAAMLMFNVFTYFTVYSQLHVMKIKSFTFFPGVRLAIPILITIALAALNPFIGIVFFVFTFLMEIFAKIYKEMDAKSRPTKGKIGQMVVIAAILVTIGAAIVQFIPENYYYIVPLTLTGPAPYWKMWFKLTFLIVPIRSYQSSPGLTMI
jgi:hypothetical protein